MNIVSLCRKISTAALAGTLIGCATGGSSGLVNVEAIPSEDQQLVYSRGLPLIKSERANSVVIISPVEAPRRQGYQDDFLIAVKNTSDSPFNFGLEQVSVEYNGLAAKVLTYPEMVNQAYSRMKSQKIAAALAFTSQTLSANQNATSSVSGFSSGTSQVYGAQGNYSGNINSSSVFSGEVYDPAKAQQIRENAAENLNQQKNAAEAQYRNKLTALDGYLRKETIFPGQIYDGIFLFQINNFRYSGPNRVAVTVDTGKDEHRFLFTEIDAALTQYQQAMADQGNQEGETNKSASNIEAAQNDSTSNDSDSEQASDQPRNIFESNFFNGRKLWNRD